jgi:K+-transporting ATPase KdpF subunit
METVSRSSGRLEDRGRDVAMTMLMWTGGVVAGLLLIYLLVALLKPEWF